LDRYLSDDFVAELAATLGSRAASYREAVADTEPVAIAVGDAGRVVAALGMAVKLAGAHVDRTRADAVGVAADGADALVGIGVAIGVAGGSARVEIGGRTLVWTRAVLVRAVELIRDGRWECPCRGRHEPGGVCDVRRSPAGADNAVRPGRGHFDHHEGGLARLDVPGSIGSPPLSER